MSDNLYRLVETTPPAIEPVALADVKTFLRVDHTGDDTLIGNLITTARQICENLTGRSLITRSYSLYLDQWPAETLSMPKPPLASLTQINIYAADSSSTVFAASNYFVDTVGVPGRVVLTEGAIAPIPGRIANGIEIQYTAGYGAASSDVPDALKEGINKIVSHLYEHRGDSADQALLTSGAEQIFKPYYLMRLS